MKKNYLLYIGLFLIIIGCCTLFFLLNNDSKKENKDTTITIDINPSIELTVNEKQIVTSVKALNDDAKNIVSKDLNNKSLDEVLDVIVDKSIELHYIDNDNVVLVNVSGELEDKVVTTKLNDKFNNRHYPVEIIVPVVTKEDEKLAKKYNITSAKAAYINEATKQNKNIKIDDLIDRPIREIKDIKETGFYCEAGYSLEGNICIKPIDEKEISIGPVCPEDYFDDNGTCYKGYQIYEKEGCTNGQTLKNGKCTGTRTVDALIKYTCQTGELTRRSEIPYRDLRDSGDPNQMMCMDKSTGQKPIQRCLLNSGHIMIDGECYNGPAPLLPTPTGCEGDDLPINGWCYSKDDGDQWQCPNGDIYEYSKDTYTEYCPDTFTYTFADSSYYCEEGYELVDNKCVTDETTKPEMIRYCKNGYTLFQDRICLDYNDYKDFIEGEVCDYPDSRPADGKCIIYEVKEALK